MPGVAGLSWQVHNVLMFHNVLLAFGKITASF